MISQSFISELIDRVDVYDVVNRRVPLKDKGDRGWACCPFHNEKTSSFSVSRSKNFYHCFGSMFDCYPVFQHLGMVYRFR